jgi:hypothetical protein
MAIHSASILLEENAKLRATNERRKKRKGKRRQCIATGGALQAQEGQALIAAAENSVQEGDQVEAASARTRAPPTCSNCHIQGHNRRQYRSI